MAIKRRVIATGRPIRDGSAAAAPGAPIQYFDTYVEPRRDGAGAITGVDCAATDITERKKSEAASLSGAVLLRTVIEATPDLVWAKDAEGRIILGNQATFDLLGAGDPEKVLGSSARELAPVPVLAQTILNNDARIMTSGLTETVEEFFGPPDRPLILETTKSPLRDGAGKVVGLVGVSRDVTEAKKAADALQRSEQRFRLATELSRTIAFTFDRDLRCTWLHGTQTQRRRNCRQNPLRPVCRRKRRSPCRPFSPSFARRRHPRGRYALESLGAAPQVSISMSSPSPCATQAMRLSGSSARRTISRRESKPQRR